MKDKLKNKKVVYTIIGIISVLLVAAAVTYAYWLVTKTQQGENVISSACLDIDLVGSGDITLPNQFPITDEDGKKLTPYEFTVTNKCSTSVDYQIALEAIGEESTSISSNALKVALNNNAGLFSSYAEVDPTIEGAYEARRIGFSRLSARGSEGASDSYSLRIWIDEDASIEEMNKTFKSKITVTIGQGIESLYEEGTLAYSILANYGGTNNIQTISIEPTEKITTISHLSVYSTYYYGTEKVLDPEEGKYTLGGTVVYATLSECRSGTKTCGKYTLMKTSPDAKSATIYEVTDFQPLPNLNSLDYTVSANKIEYTTEFSRGTTASDAGLYKAQDDLGTSYYFRGAPTNNYVEFGTYAESIPDKYYVYLGEEVYGEYYNLEECEADEIVTDFGGKCVKAAGAKAGDPMYWRIVRVNGNGTVRLIYDGTQKVENGVEHPATIGNTAYNTNSDDAKYVGYTYDVDGTETNSTIKGVVDAWYDKHLKTTYGKYIADGIFCNDRQVTSSDKYSTYFAPYDRLYKNEVPAPILTCTNKEDRYTTSTELGNGKLTDAEGNARPIGLLTADEVVFAGGKVNYGSSKSSFYLYSGETYWTSAPSDSSDAYVWYVEGGSVNNYDFGVDCGDLGARPVINLKADTLIEGKGTIDSPYKVVMN